MKYELSEYSKMLMRFGVPRGLVPQPPHVPTIEEIFRRLDERNANANRKHRN